MSIQLYSHSKHDLEKAVEIILKKHAEFSIAVPQKNTELPDDFISQSDASKFLHVTLPTIIAWRKYKDLPFYRFNGRFYYSKKELLEYGKNNRK